MENLIIDLSEYNIDTQFDSGFNIEVIDTITITDIEEMFAEDMVIAKVEINEKNFVLSEHITDGKLERGSDSVWLNGETSLEDFLVSNTPFSEEVKDLIYDVIDKELTQTLTEDKVYEAAEKAGLRFDYRDPYNSNKWVLRYPDGITFGWYESLNSTMEAINTHEDR